MNRGDIDAHSRKLEKTILSRINKEDCLYSGHVFETIQKKDENISKEYEAYLAKLPRSTTNQIEEVADTYYNYAIHLAILRTYHFSCYEQIVTANETSEQTNEIPGHLILAIIKSAHALECLDHARELYVDQHDKETTQKKRDKEHETHAKILNAFKQRLGITNVPISANASNRPSKRPAPSHSGDSESSKRIKLTTNADNFSINSNPHSFFGTGTPSNTDSAKSTRTITGINLSSLETLKQYMKQHDGHLPPPSPQETLLLEQNLFQEKELIYSAQEIMGTATVVKNF